MGFNTTLVVLDDYLFDIEKDPNFGKKLRDAISRCFCGLSHDVDYGVKIAAIHHADETVLVAVGGNCATEITATRNIPFHGSEDGQLELLKVFADKMGYKLQKKK